ncbi:MAG: hypothetical protein WD231_05095 [Candidatus Woykebacteria bacterium]
MRAKKLVEVFVPLLVFSLFFFILYLFSKEQVAALYSAYREGQFQVPSSPEFGAQFLVSVGSYVVGLASPIIGGWWVLVAYKRRVARIAAVDRVESLLTGGYKEKLIQRELENWEKVVLEHKYKDTGDREFDLDRRSPVFSVQGRLVKLEVKTESKMTKVEWSIRGFKIDENNYSDIRFRSFQEGQELIVEFSPFSHWVWDVYRVIDGKREWLLNTNHDNFNLLKAGLVNIVLRAPFGSHQYQNMKEGDLINFSYGNDEIGFIDSSQIEVRYIKHYRNIDDLLKTEGLVNVFPKAKDIGEAIKIINSFTNYDQRIKRGGVYAIGIKYVE